MKDNDREELFLDYWDTYTSQDYIDLSRLLLQIRANAVSLILKSSCSQRVILILNHPEVLNLFLVILFLLLENEV